MNTTSKPDAITKPASASKFGWLMILAVAVVQTAILGYMIWDRATLLSDGREIVLDVTPVDPRSLFRGDYVILSYGNLSRIDLKALKTTAPNKGAHAFITLQKNAGGEWQPIAVDDAYPNQRGDGDIILRGKIERASNSSAQIRYGIEAYFVPEGTGRDIEKMIGEKKIQVVAAVDKAGRAAIKALIADGKRIYNEPVL